MSISRETPAEPDLHVHRDERWVVIKNVRTGEAICLPRGASLDEACDMALRRWGEAD